MSCTKQVPEWHAVALEVGIGVPALASPAIEGLSREVVQLREQRKVMLEALRAADCACTVKERMSGHLVGCFMPQVQAAIAIAEGRSA